jgi:hypothetical protein
MKTTALLLSLLLFAACASPTAVIDKRMLGCESGQDLSVAAGFNPGTDPNEMGERYFTVEVSNNSDHEVTVTSVHIDPSDANRGLGTAYDNTEVTIAAGEDHLFRLRASSALGAPSPAHAVLGRSSGVVEFSVTVRLSNGDSYRCPFRAEVR